MGQNRYRLFEKNECIKIEQDIETLHNLIVPEQLLCHFVIHMNRFINIISIFVLYDLNRYVDIGLNLKSKMEIKLLYSHSKVSNEGATY